jgi:hypothetical protein
MKSPVDLAEKETVYAALDAEPPVSYSLDVATILFQHGVRTLYSDDRHFRKFQSARPVLLSMPLSGRSTGLF